MFCADSAAYGTEGEIWSSVLDAVLAYAAITGENLLPQS